MHYKPAGQAGASKGGFGGGLASNCIN